MSLFGTPLPSNGSQPPALTSVTTPGALPNPLTFRVRPDQGGDSGVIAGSFRDGGLCTQDAGDAVFGRIDSVSAAVTGGIVTACDMLVASSEDQTALLVWRANMQGQVGTAFWQPRGRNAPLPPNPDYWLSSPEGFLSWEAIATNGARHAAIVPQVLGSVVTVPDAGMQFGTADGYLMVVLGGGPPRFVDVGPGAGPPFGLAFGSHACTPGLFVMANCTGAGTLCSGAGSVVGFLPQP